MTTLSEVMPDPVWARIIPFLRAIEPFIRDPEISDIMVNGEQGVFLEKEGRIDLEALRKELKQQVETRGSPPSKMPSPKAADVYQSLLRA